MSVEARKSIKQGPGMFVYDGSAEDHEDTPGVPKKDKHGNQVGWEKAPKRDRMVLKTYKAWGVEFPAGKPVAVDDVKLAVKLRCLPSFEELEGETAEAAYAPKRGRGRRRKAGTEPELEGETAEAAETEA